VQLSFHYQTARKQIKGLYFQALECLGARFWKVNWLLWACRAPILNLHRVSPDSNPYWPPLHPKHFEELLRYVTEHFDVCSLQQLKRGRFNKPPLVLSFDDGYLDFFEYAYPLLKKYRLKANMNIIPGCVTSGRPPWNVRIYDFLNQAPHKAIEQIDLPNFNSNATNKGLFGLSISRYLKNRQRQERLELLHVLEERVFSKHSYLETPMMSKREIVEIQDLVDLGAHSFSHESMGYETDDFFKDDYNQCCSWFKSELNQKVETYAFPNGSYRASQVEFLREQSVSNILLVDEILAIPGNAILPRKTFHAESQVEVRMRALGF
jgi:peptidoglycan/xylan/chitin deacetylase (PgdA/CDA1 family)